MAPDVVSGRDHVRPRGEQLLGDLRRQACAVGCVLAVDDAEVDPELVSELGKALLERAPAGGPENISDEEDPQGAASGPAGDVAEALTRGRRARLGPRAPAYEAIRGRPRTTHRDAFQSSRARWMLPVGPLLASK